MKISIITPINSLSYGIAGTHIVHELIKAGHEISLFPIGRAECHPKHAESIKKALNNADQFSISAPCIRLFHQFDLSMFVGHGDHIGFPIFELDQFNNKEKHHLSSCDRLFVCSHWARNIIGKNIESMKNGDDSIECTHVIPMGVDGSVFKPKLSTRRPTIFLNVGKWEKRKGHDVLMRAFELAFSDTDNVELWMMCHNMFLNDEKTQEWRNQYENSKLGNKIRFIPHVETDDQVAEIMQQADCGVFPSRAEGWNLPALEMLSCGKQLIITDYSAHTEFCNSTNSWLVPINEVEPAFDDIWFHGQGSWGKISDDTMHSLIGHMRYIHSIKKDGGLDLNKEGIATTNRYSWKNTADCIIKNLEDSLCF